MIFKEVQHLLESQPDYTTSQQSDMLQRCRDKPFWIWDNANHSDKNRTQRGDCCFTDIIGRPRKNGNGNRKPFYDYQKMLFLALFRPGYLNSTASHPNEALYPFKEKHLWVKKSTGLGVSEFFLRLMAWLCVRNDDYKDSQMVIVTGPNIDLSIKLIRRMKKLFQDKLDVSFDSKETVLELNGCEIQSYPSNHIDSFRSLTNPRFIFIDETDFLPKFQQEEVRAVSERYIAKSDPDQQPVKKAPEFDIPDPSTDSHDSVIGDNDIPIAVIDNVKPTSTTFGNQKLPAALCSVGTSGIQIFNL